jgi:AcrR family transcriptional regulator
MPRKPQAKRAPTTNRAVSVQHPPQRADAIRNRKLLFDAAAKVFAERGFEGSVHEVAREAGVAVGTIYRHFESKDALIDELVRQLLEEVLDMSTSALEQPDGQGLSIFLHGIGEQQTWVHDCLPRLWTEAVRDHKDTHLRALIHDKIAELLADAQRHGVVRQELTDIDVFAVILSLRGIIQTMGHAAPDQWRRHLEVILAGFEPSSKPLKEKPAPKGAVDIFAVRPIADHS